MSPPGSALTKMMFAVVICIVAANVFAAAVAPLQIRPAEVLKTSNVDDAAPTEPCIPPDNRSRLFPADGANVRQDSAHVLYERVIAVYDDPLTPPKTKADCIGYAWGDLPFGGQWKTCNEWALRCIKMRREVYMTVHTVGIDSATVQQKVSDCLKAAAVIGAGTAVAEVLFGAGATGGSGAVATFKTTLAACLAADFAASLLSVDVADRGGWWDDWGSC